MKLVVQEDGSHEAGAMWDASDIVVTSRVSYAEARVALAAARRRGRLSARSLAGAKESLEERFRALLLVEVSAGVVRSAGELAETHDLRAYDAVQLASALAVAAPDTLLVTWDQDLARASENAGLDVAPLRRA